MTSALDDSSGKNAAELKILQQEAEKKISDLEKPTKSFDFLINNILTRIKTPKQEIQNVELEQLPSEKK